MNEYIDVRGAWPVYFNGFLSYELINFTRDVPLHIARSEYNRSIGIPQVDTQSEA